MRKLFPVLLASALFSACGGSEPVAPPNAYTIAGQWAVTGAVTGTLTLAADSVEHNADGSRAAELYTGAMGSTKATARQPFLNGFYDPHFTVTGVAIDATLSDHDHWTGTSGGAAISGVRQ